MNETSKKIPLRQYWALLGRYLRPQRGWVGALAALLFGGIGLQLWSPQLLRRFIDGAGDAAVPLDDVLATALLFVGVALAQQVLNVLATYTGERIGWTATNGLRADLTLHCLQLDMPFHNERTPGEMIERIDGDVASLASFFSQFAVRLTGNLLLLAGTLVVFAAQDLRLCAAMTAYAALTLLALSRVTGVAVPLWRQSRQAAADLFGFLEERLAGTVDIRALGAVPYAMGRLAHYTGQRLQTELRASVANIRIRYLHTGLYSLGQILAVSAGYLLYREGSASVGTVAMIVAYTDLLFRPLRQLTQQMEELQQAGASVGRVGELFQETSRIDTPEPLALPRGALTVEFRDVSFGYRGDEPVLEGLTFDVQAGRVLGLLGRTGSGKTTISRLLFRLYDPQGGSVRLGGTDLRRAEPGDLAARVGMVTQSVQLFRGTLRQNLTLFDDTVDDERLVAALHDVGMGAWYDGLPGGLDWEMASDGGGLSAGEAQLLTFARVFLRDPGLIILDEASSRLDPATEAQIERAVDRLLARRTAVVIAHRLGTVQRADDILILEDGRVEEWGARRALAADPGSRFAQLLRTGLTEVLE